MLLTKARKTSLVNLALLTALARLTARELAQGTVTDG